MEQQELKIEFKDKERTIGTLTIRPINRTSSSTNHKKTSENFQKYNINFKNIPKTIQNNSRTPIIYKTKDSKYNSPLMLLEETDYQLIFKSEKSGDSISFPFIEEKCDEINFKKFNMPQGLHGGILNFKSYVGQSFFNIQLDEIKTAKYPFEVRSKKMDYIDHYPAMIADISEAISGLIYREKSPLFRLIDFKDRVKRSFYEDFMFLEYIFRPENLITAYGHVKRDPHHVLKKYMEVIPAAAASHVGPSDVINMITTPGNLTKYKTTPNDWPSGFKGYVPEKITSHASEDTYDNPENRFIKYFLNQLHDLIEEMLNYVKAENIEGYPVEQLKLYKNLIFEFIMDRWLDDIGDLDYFPSNSQILQKKEGYRDILNYFIIFELSFSPKFQALDDLIKGYQKKLSELYEYWCYLQLFNILKKLENSKPNYNQLFNFKKKEWQVNIKYGEKSSQNFLLEIKDTKYSVDLIYNRTFDLDTKPNRCYSLPLRPDYTLRIHADKGIYLVHLDAKYKCDINTSFINEDIYKMHTYKDAIENTIGAYVLYPGREMKIFTEEPNKELPSVGAIPLTPGILNHDEENLSHFIENIVEEINNESDER